MCIIQEHTSDPQGLFPPLEFSGQQPPGNSCLQVWSSPWEIHSYSHCTCLRHGRDLQQRIVIHLQHLHNVLSTQKESPKRFRLIQSPRKDVGTEPYLQGNIEVSEVRKEIAEEHSSCVAPWHFCKVKWLTKRYYKSTRRRAHNYSGSFFSVYSCYTSNPKKTEKL